MEDKITAAKEFVKNKLPDLTDYEPIVCYKHGVGNSNEKFHTVTFFKTYKTEDNNEIKKYLRITLDKDNNVVRHCISK